RSEAHQLARQRGLIEVAARLNGLAPQDVALELVLNDSARTRLAPQGPLEGGEHLYALEFAPEPSGRIEYRLRAYPTHELLAHPFETGLMTWL
ncbi:MAG TPA: hypothetical protein VJ789_09505, partial [Burkholderiales bacterium]|nr:hypothetical protein [Burkholderiales bacterium]